MSSLIRSNPRFRMLENQVEEAANAHDDSLKGLPYLTSRRRRVFSMAVANAIQPLMFHRMWRAERAVKKHGGTGPMIVGLPRVGADGTEFKQLKYRTMVAGSEHDTGMHWKRAGDSRKIPELAHLRASSRDETPQIINVLRGEMLMVGPRPQPQVELDIHGRLPQAHLWLPIYFAGPPALTGVVQIDPVLRNEGGEDEFGLMRRQEREIIWGQEEASIANDALIILRTAFTRDVTGV